MGPNMRYNMREEDCHNIALSLAKEFGITYEQAMENLKKTVSLIYYNGYAVTNARYRG